MCLLRLIILILLVALSGCKTMSNPSSFAKWTLPLNVAASWFVPLAIHEGGHAAAAEYYGAESIKVDLLPGRYDDGEWHAGYTTAKFQDGLSDSGATVFNIAGPSSTFLSHVVFREALIGGWVPRHLQGMVAWMDLGCMISTYTHSIYGLARIEHTDFGKEDAWIAGGFLLAQLTYDLIRLVWAPGGIKRYFKVLIGEDFYE